MRKHLLFLFLLTSLHASAQWQRAPWPGIDTGIDYLKNISCFRQINGKLFACASNGLFISEDNGGTWNRVEAVSPYFAPSMITESDEGIFLYGSDSSTGFPYTGYVNTDKQGYTWEPSAVLPSCNSFVKIGNTHFAISFAVSFAGIVTSTNAGLNWQEIPTPGGNLYTPSRFTWNHDTLYANYQEDRRVYRSIDEGVSWQLFSPFMIRGFQKGDGWFAGQLLVGSLSSPGNSDTLMYTLDEGATWQKWKLPFLSPGDNVLCFKYGNSLYLQRNTATLSPMYAVDLLTQSFTDTIPGAASFNSNDQNYQFGGISGACYYGLNGDTIYSVCNGVRTNLTSPGGAVGLKEMVTWRDSLYLVQSTSTVNHRAFLTTDLDQPPTDLAPVERLAYYKPAAYAVVNDTVYSIDATFPNYIAKYHVPTQTKVMEKVVADGTQLDEVYRTATHLAARQYDYIYFRKLQETTWQTFSVLNLEFAANTDYLYHFNFYVGTLHRRGASGMEETFQIPGYTGSDPMLTAHDSVVMVAAHDPANPYYWLNLYVSTDYGETFSTIDLTQLGAEEMFNMRYLSGKVFVQRLFSGIYAYEPATDTWSPYNDGLYEVPNSIASLDGELLVTCPNSGLYRRGVQPTYNARGRVYLDENANGVWDVGEIPVENIGVNAFFAGGVYYSLSDGSYISATDVPVDTHRLLLPHPLMSSVPEKIVTDNTNATTDFALQLPGNARDLSVSPYATGPFRPGFNTTVHVSVKNRLLPVSGARLILKLPSDAVSVLGTVPAASFTSPAGDSLVWEFGDLGLFSDTAVTLELQTLLTTTLGTFVEIDAKVESNEPDVQPADNRALLQNVVVGSYDPNDKLVSREAVTIESPPSKAELAYTIRFQNTGTYPTSFVTLLDTLDADVFDLASLRWLGSSHPFEARMVDGNVLKIRFDTLALVPQAESEALSQGFVAFALTTREPLASPQVISNRAGIYFDYNEPVITPYARTVVDFTIGTEEAPAYSGMTLSPNPAGDWVTLVDGTHLHEVVDVSLFDNAGRLVLQQTITPSDNVVNLTSLPPGVYWIIARQNDRTMTGKFIKQ